MEKNSNKVLKGAGRAPHRSLFYAMGYTPEDLERPLIGVVNSQNEIVPGHFHLDTITNAVKSGISSAGGTPIEFPANRDLRRHCNGTPRHALTRLLHVN